MQPVELMASRQPVDEEPPYARLLQAAMAGVQACFHGKTPSRPSGGSLTPFSSNPTPLHFYEPGTWGPSEADCLLPRVPEWHDP